MVGLKYLPNSRGECELEDDVVARPGPILLNLELPSVECQAVQILTIQGRDGACRMRFQNLFLKGGERIAERCAVPALQVGLATGASLLRGMLMRGRSGCGRAFGSGARARWGRWSLSVRRWDGARGRLVERFGGEGGHRATPRLRSETWGDAP